MRERDDQIEATGPTAKSVQSSDAARREKRQPSCNRDPPRRAVVPAQESHTPRRMGSLACPTLPILPAPGMVLALARSFGGTGEAVPTCRLPEIAERHGSPPEANCLPKRPREMKAQIGPMLLDLPYFWESEDVQMMTYEQVGVYWALLSHQWQEGSIPRDARRIAVILCRGARRVTLADLVGAPRIVEAPLEGSLRAPPEGTLEASLEAPLEGSLWAALRTCFEPHPEDDSRLVNPRLHSQREDWRNKHQAFVEAGRKGGRRSGVKRRKTKGSGTQAPPEGSLEATLEGRLPQRLEASLDKKRQDKIRQDKTGSDKKRQEKKTRDRSDELAPEVQALDTLSETEKLKLAQLLLTPDEIDPKGKRAAKRTNTAAMRAERGHLLAWLQVTTSPVVDDADNALELWALWRANRRAKHRLSAERTPWLSEVDALRKLHQADRPPGDILAALSTAAKHSWQGFKWEWVNPDGGRRRPRGVTGAAGHLPADTHEEVPL
ncbi:MAG: hypothetical protein GY856_15200 [bacterium]|nr:hypothetical protein [bacterium]